MNDNYSSAPKKCNAINCPKEPSHKKEPRPQLCYVLASACCFIVCSNTCNATAG